MTDAPHGTLRLPGTPDRLVVVWSDIEMGAGGAFDDFPHSPFLAERILRYTMEPYEGLAVDLVFNGDTFDLLKTSHEGTYPHHVSEAVALAKMTRVADAHPMFFTAVGAFLDRMGPRGRVFFITGNHDAELLFPAVKELVRARCGGSGAIGFADWFLDIGRMHIEHGSQADPLFRMNPAQPFVGYHGERLLNLPWAAVGLLDVAIPLQPLLYHHDRLRPRRLVLRLVPEMKELLTRVFWQYWTKDYWRDFLRGANPVKRVSWGMLRELVRRIASRDPDITLGNTFHRQMIESDRYDLYVMGHQHEPGWWSHGRRKVLRTGPLRDEFMLSADGLTQTALNKTWAEAYLSGDEVVRSHLVEVTGPLRSPETVQSDIFAVVPEIRALLARHEPAGDVPRVTRRFLRRSRPPR